MVLSRSSALGRLRLGAHSLVYDVMPRIPLSISLSYYLIYLSMFSSSSSALRRLNSWSTSQGNFILSFVLGWSVTTFSGTCAYPFDTVRRRMMLSSGQHVKYDNGIQALKHIVRHEGPMALFRGLTANMLSGMAGAGVLAGYDQLQRLSSVHGYAFGHQLRGGLK